MPIMPRLLLSAFLVFFVFSPVVSLANVIDRSVAIVNEDTITLSEVNEAGEALFAKISRETPANRLAETLEQARRTVIDKLIDKKLVIQEAKKRKIQATDQEVDNALQRVLTNNKTSVEQMRQELRSIGLTEKMYREELREQILTSKLINHEVRAKVAIPEDTVLHYYNTHITTPARNRAYHIQQIGVTWDNALADGTAPSQAEALNRVQAAHKLAQNGKNFKELVHQYSNLPSVADDGDLGTFSQDDMAATMRDAVANLKPGEISPIVAIETSYQFFKLVSSQEGKILAHEPYESVKEQIREKLYQEAIEQRYKNWTTSIRQKAYIRIF